MRFEGFGLEMTQMIMFKSVIQQYSERSREREPLEPSAGDAPPLFALYVPRRQTANTARPPNRLSFTYLLMAATHRRASRLLTSLTLYSVPHFRAVPQSCAV